MGDHEVMRVGEMRKGMLWRREGHGEGVLGMMVWERVLVVMRDDLVGRHRVRERMAHGMKVLVLMLEMKRNGHGVVGKGKRDRVGMGMGLEGRRGSFVDEVRGVSDVSAFDPFGPPSLSAHALFRCFWIVLFLHQRVVQDLLDHVDLLQELQALDSRVLAQLQPSLLALVRRPVSPSLSSVLSLGLS